MGIIVSFTNKFKQKPKVKHISTDLWEPREIKILKKEDFKERGIFYGEDIC